MQRWVEEQKWGREIVEKGGEKGGKNKRCVCGGDRVSGILAENRLEGGWQDTVLLISLFSSHRVFPLLLYILLSSQPPPLSSSSPLLPSSIDFLSVLSSQPPTPAPSICSLFLFGFFHAGRRGMLCLSWHLYITFPIRRDGGEGRREIKRRKRIERRGRGGGGAGKEKRCQSETKREDHAASWLNEHGQRMITIE